MKVGIERYLVEIPKSETIPPHGQSLRVVRRRNQEIWGRLDEAELGLPPSRSDFEKPTIPFEIQATIAALPFRG